METKEDDFQFNSLALFYLLDNVTNHRGSMLGNHKVACFKKKLT